MVGVTTYIRYSVRHYSFTMKRDKGLTMQHIQKMNCETLVGSSNLNSTTIIQHMLIKANTVY